MSSPLLPIVKTISYSALSDWNLCPYYYFLADVKRLKTFKNTSDTIFGTMMHQYCQDILEDKISTEAAISHFKRKWKKFCSLFKEKNFAHYEQGGENILSVLKNELQSYFGKFKVVEVEYRLSAPNGSRWPQRFKGLIDIVLELENGRKVVADFKTANSTFFFVRYKNRFKDYQLILYKHFYCLEKNIKTEDIDTYFFVLEKNPASKKPVSIVGVTSGKRKMENALGWMSVALSAISREVFLRNRTGCFAYGSDHPCEFYRSKECP